MARRDDVLRVPAAALRFKPDAAVLAHFGAASAAAAPAGKSATVWVIDRRRRSRPSPVTTGATDGTYTEVIGAPFAEGALVVTRATAARDRGEGVDRGRQSADAVAPGVGALIHGRIDCDCTVARSPGDRRDP